MNRYLLLTGGVINLLLAIFKIAMPHLFHWQRSMTGAERGMWAILYAENLGISLLLLFFAYMSLFLWRELLSTRLGKAVMLSIAALWVFRATAEIVLFKIGVDGAWWRVFLFLATGVVYMIPIASNKQWHKFQPGEMLAQTDRR